MNADLLHRNMYKSNRPLPIAPSVAPSVYRGDGAGKKDGIEGGWDYDAS